MLHAVNMECITQPTDIPCCDQMELQDFSIPFIRNSKCFRKITKPKQKTSKMLLQPEVYVTRSSGELQLTRPFPKDSHDVDSLGTSCEIMGLNLLSCATSFGLGMMLGQYRDEGRCASYTENI